MSIDFSKRHPQDNIRIQYLNTKLTNFSEKDEFLDYFPDLLP